MNFNSSRTDYDAIAAEWDRTRQREWGEFQFLRSFLKNGSKLLDAGCGNGRLVKFLDKELGADQYQYLGVDSSEELLKLAQKNCPAREFQKADLVEFCQPESFELVACIAVLHHLPTAAERLCVLQNLQKSLKPGGRLFLTVWNLWQPRYLQYVLRSYFTRAPRDCQIPFAGRITRFVHAFTAGELLKLAEQAGFREIEVFPAYQDKRAKIFSARNLILLAQK